MASNIPRPARVTEQSNAPLDRRRFMAGCAATAALLTLASPTRAPALTPLVARRSKLLSRGVNASQWFEWVPGDRLAMDRYLGEKYQTADFALLRSLGFNHVRVTLQPGFLAPKLEEGDPTLDPARLARLDEAMNRILSNDLALVLDCHATEPNKNRMASDPAYLAAVAAWWQNLAHHVAHTAQYRPERVFLELLNEPPAAFDDARLYRGAIEQLLGGARRGAPDHTIIVGGNQMNIGESLARIFDPPLADGNVVYTFHFYQPMDFTHQAMVNAGPYFAKLKDVPWDVDAGALREQDITTHHPDVQEGMRQYNQKPHRKADLRWLFAAVRKWCDTHDQVAWLGEFGVYAPAAAPAQRAAWIRDVRELAEEHRFGWCHYEARGGFGMFLDDDRPLRVDGSILAALGMDKKGRPH